MNEAKSAVLLIIFNRPEMAQRVFETIRKYQPSSLYIAADGLRPSVPQDAIDCKATRNVVEKVDWPCTVKTLFREHNAGFRIAVSEAVSWFFSNEEEGIILEDDCLPGESFFNFCHLLLAKYRDDHRIMHIGGCNLQFGRQRGDASYYFSSIPSIWGWAGWKRVWDKYDRDMHLLPEFEKQDLMRFIFPDAATSQWASNAARAVYENKIQTWDYQLSFSIIINNGLCIVPNRNLVSNIGFGESGSRTKDASDIHANIPVERLDEITHPQFFIPNRDADQYQLSLSMPKEQAAPSRASLFQKIVNKAKGAGVKSF